MTSEIPALGSDGGAGHEPSLGSIIRTANGLGVPRAYRGAAAFSIAAGTWYDRRLHLELIPMPLLWRNTPRNRRLAVVRDG